MDSSSYYDSDSTNPVSDKEINSDKELNNSNIELTNSNNELINLSDNDNETEINTESSFNSKDYNNKSFKLNDEKSSVYILKKRLYSYILLSINLKKRLKNARLIY